MAGTTISSTAMNGDLTDIASALTGSISADGQTTITGQLKAPNGTAAAPAFSFASDLTTGMYYVGTKKLGFAAGGTAAVFIDQNNVGSGQSGNQLYFANTAVLNPVGMVTNFAGATAPAGWLLCFGQSLLITNYPELFVAISNAYGGDGVTTFFAPDCRGRGTYGKDNMGGSAANRITVAGGNFDGTVLGGTGGAQNYTLLQTNLPAIKPAITITDPGHIHAIPAILTAANQSGAGAYLDAGSTQINTASATTGVTAAFTSNLGSSTAFGIVNPAIIFNKIIFAGRP